MLVCTDGWCRWWLECVDAGLRVCIDGWCALILVCIDDWFASMIGLHACLQRTREEKEKEKDWDIKNNENPHLRVGGKKPSVRH